MFKNKSILVTGGTGSFGKKFVEIVSKKYSNQIKKLIIFSRDELKQHDMSQAFNIDKYPFIRFFIGDVRDKERLNKAFKDIDYVIHAAALKQVPTSEYNPFETIKTNILGTQNVVDACIDNNVEKLVALSTDKASSPINLYGATKLCSDKLVVGSQNTKGNIKFTACVVRYGNVLGSRGSVLPEFIKQKRKNLFTITSEEMTRFNILLEDGIKLVLWSLKNSKGGEIFIPKIPSFKVIDLAKAIDNKCKIKIIGIRPGEKLHEEMISVSESYNTVDFGNYYSILPNFHDYSRDQYIKKFGGKKVKKNFSYNSFENKDYLSIADLKKLIKNFKF